MQVVSDGMVPCHRWVLDLMNAGEISAGAGLAQKEAICLLGGRCTYPGCSVTKHYMLTIAHRYGDGAVHRKGFVDHYTMSFGGTRARATPGYAYYRDIIRDINEGRGNRYILLCENHHREVDWMARKEKRRAAQRGTLR